MRGRAHPKIREKFMWSNPFPHKKVRHPLFWLFFCFPTESLSSCFWPHSNTQYKTLSLLYIGIDPLVFSSLDSNLQKRTTFLLLFVFISTMFWFWHGLITVLISSGKGCWLWNNTPALLSPNICKESTMRREKCCLNNVLAFFSSCQKVLSIFMA